MSKCRAQRLDAGGKAESFVLVPKSPPGVPVTNPLTLAAGASTSLNVVAEFVETDPNHIYTTLIETDLGGGGHEALASVSLESVIPDGSEASLDITRSGNNAVIDWLGMGTKQSADAPGGPWTSLPFDLDTPFIFQLDVPRKFFRETE